MSKYVRKIAQLVVAMVVAVAPVAFAIPAHASPYTSGGGTISPANPAPGGSCTVTGTGFKPDSSVAVQILSTPVHLASVTADANGLATATVTIPASFASGSAHTIQLVGLDSTGAEYAVSIPVTLGSTGTALPKTGTNLGYLWFGVMALVLGVLLVVVARRRRASSR